MRRLSALAAALAFAIGGCAGAAPAASPSAGLATPPADATTAPSTASQGAWHGTVTFRAVINELKDGPSPDDPKMTIHEETRVDVTDVFTVGGPDPDDVADFGTILVNFTGSVANHGTTLERYVYTSDKVNALGCHYTDEVGTDVTGPWTQNATAAGKLRFAEDGSYTIDMVTGSDPVTGESLPTPQLPKKLWETITIIAGAAKDCPAGLGKQTTTEGPVLLWASSALGAYDEIAGHVAASSPGSVVDGSTTFVVNLPLKATVTVTWHLAHDGPIVLPHG
jgi:hypothetical protein